MSNVARSIRADHRNHENPASRSAAVWGGIGLTKKQEAFAQNVADGLNHSAAYRKAYTTDDMAPNTVWREARRLSRNDKVAARIAELVAAREEDDRLRSAKRARRVLDQLEAIMDSGQTDSARLRAAELLGRTVGLFNQKDETAHRPKTIADLERELAALLDPCR